MIEIIAGVWATCFLISLPITFWNVRSVVQKAKSPQFKTLNLNLAKVGMFWSLSSDGFQPLGERTAKDDTRKAMRSYMLIGGLGIFSVIGLLLLIAVSLSMHLLVNRTAQRVFASELTQNPNLDAEATQALVTSLS
ncbi:MAG: hypothetical protein JSU04_04465 [Bdellovibrionales bacterium]|nr:hypothetical protein [Bdellovibrionales bacterium]